MKKIVFILFIFCQTVVAQVLEGQVYDSQTQQPLPSATIYIDGTTISTTTNEEGFFSIDAKGFSASQLVISYVGYITSRLENVFQHKKIKTFLEPDAFTIPEVVVGKSPFTRKKMLETFRQQFLGKTKSGQKCKILNEDDIHLFYDMDTNILHASAQKTLKIENPELDYVVFFDLVEMTVEYKTMTLDSFSIVRDFFYGTTFYQDVSKKNKADKKRVETYKGSVPHLVRTMAENSWGPDNFYLIVDKMRVAPTDYLAVSDTLNFKKITLIKQPTSRQFEVKKEMVNGKMEITRTDQYTDRPTNFTIMHGKNISVLQFVENEILVDENGNYAPMTALAFGGFLGQQKVGDMLPTNYYQEHKDQL